MFGGGTSRTYGVKFQARCIAAQAGEKHHTRFLVGTLSLREENEVHLIQLADDGSEVTCEGLYLHQHEIWDLATCPFDSALLSTVYASAGEYHAAIWRIPDKAFSHGTGAPSLQLAAELKGLEAPVKKVLWYGGDVALHRVITIDEEVICAWDLASSTRAAQFATAKQRVTGSGLQRLHTGAWDPHNADTVATTADTSIACWDLRAAIKTASIEGAHHLQIRDIDFNPNHPHILASAGDDSRIRLWDLRSTKQAIVELPGHSHWTCSVRYNRFYDELLLSSGTDSAVNLWHVPSASAAALADHLRSIPNPAGSGRAAAVAAAGGSPRGPLDELAVSFTDYEDSVYGITWSAIDPWVFASLSYDGRVVVDLVPTVVRSRCRH
ncbi:hypothetical protein CLOM_g16167 [Closterium sp. NIES-68]|nr:hypothetical protein CLOM_g14413 [Closterium sp. NIES-68]GJP57128.1 hypothetical protein CLOM_g16167 [Closterium sp. NIES-68]GJP72322.1 hypothetical protein CLOP_g3066 [Closterium sp. NIES-67]GJP74164.1 hypothetical protein CLOP_g4792 [Closterium sp. NIES-67]